METQTEPATAKSVTVLSVALRYGFFLALAAIAFDVILIILGANPLESDWKGFIRLAVSLTILVFAHRYFKLNGDGYMTYGQGFGITFLAVMLSAAISGLFIYIYVTIIDPGIMEDLYQKTREGMEAKGQGEEQIEVALMWTKKLFWVIFIVFSLLISAVLAAIIPIFTQKKNPEPFS